ncbi:hypothetical protein CCOS865_02962 [Pseudomonas reidholzensis]|uniref:Uncharacterized protein n=1 Tax=Pseudomonas reidholzensis TaxID=1785162 RepID=A0A383RUV9_9PSED|nr:hypothetical protein [Pseudomonas reidholzensis]SYX90695.1 hypothetical protein CCOS865_02962 [Pseudomonas reidholzensis]
MTIEAETLTQLTEALAKRGLTRLVQVRFTRTPYRCNHKWTCEVR